MPSPICVVCKNQCWPNPFFGDYSKYCSNKCRFIDMGQQINKPIIMLPKIKRKDSKINSRSKLVKKNI